VIGGNPARLAGMIGTEPRPDLVPPELLERVVRYFDPQAVILFGSHARGDADEDSDYDLLVILDDDAPAEKRRLQAGYESRRGWHGAVDVIPCTRSVFERRRRVIGSLPDIAAHEGVVVYTRA
jgi:predicted nucleotidyltransferase